VFLGKAKAEQGDEEEVRGRKEREG